MSAFAEFARHCGASPPRVAVVLGSGLAGAAGEFVTAASVDYGDIPGLVPPSVSGHGGKLSVGDWSGVRALVCAGRVHFYEGHDWPRVTRLVELAADLGAGTLILTNAAGGIDPDLEPGDLMAIRGHWPLLGPGAWADRDFVSGTYTPELLAVARQCR